MTETHPILAIKVKEAVENGGRLVVINSENNNWDFSFNYKSLIPLQMIDDFKRPMYDPKKFIFEKEQKIRLGDCGNFK